MAKKKIMVLLLVFLCAGMVFAQRADPKFAVGLDLGRTFTGFIASEINHDTNVNLRKTYVALSPTLEFAIGHYSLGLHSDLIFGGTGTGTARQRVTHIGLALMGRWYPLARMHKLYLGTEIGFDTCRIRDAEKSLYTGLTFAARAGWRQLMGPVFLEPHVGYVVSKSAGAYMPITPAGWEAGLYFGFAL
jgi:hypothetical protein